MSRLNIDSWTIHSDSRFDLLAEFYPFDAETKSGFIDRHHARGHLEKAWLECLVRETYELSEHEVRACLNQPFNRQGELVHALVQSRLATQNKAEGTVYLRGTRGRIEWLQERREIAVKAGKASGKARKKTSNIRLTSRSTRAAVPLNPPAMAPAIAITPAQVDINLSTSRKRAATPPSPDHQAFVKFFDSLYAENHDGAKPTWGPKPGAIVKRLLKAHGIEECKRRTEILFSSPPAWITSRDIQTLSAHFDKLATPTKGGAGVANGGMSAQEIWDLAEQVKAQEAACRAK